MVQKNDKGRRWENETKPWIKAIWPRAQRNGIGFVGSDFRETDDFAFECKNHSRMELSTWMNQAVLNAQRESRRFPVLLHKRRRYGPAGAYVTMRLGDWFKMVAELKGVTLPEDLVDPGEDEIPDWT